MARLRLFSPFIRSYSVKVYTRTGDKGTTSLFNGERREKSHKVFDALGGTDETNSFIGCALSSLPKESITAEIPMDHWLQNVQSRLLDLGSAIATPQNENSTEARINRVHFDEKHITELENWIDEMDKQLPPLTNFILPGGGTTASFLHVARTVCRRAERSTTELSHELPSAVPKYLNRLSDFLFVSARYVAMKEGVPDTIYKKVKE